MTLLLDPTVVAVGAAAVTQEQPASDATRIDEALHIAWQYGQIDGDHHKAWVIDQMVQKLTGKEYGAWIADYCKGDGKDNTYTWEHGTPP